MRLSSEWLKKYLVFCIANMLPSCQYSSHNDINIMYTHWLITSIQVRQLEFLLADALQKGCDCVITCGGLESNHCRVTTAAARQLGLQAHIVLRWSGNVVSWLSSLLPAIIYHDCYRNYKQGWVGRGEEMEISTFYTFHWPHQRNYVNDVILYIGSWCSSLWRELTTWQMCWC